MVNPFDFGKSMFETWEKTMAESLERLTHDESFLKNMGNAVSNSLDLKKQFEENLEKYLRAINMPTKSDLERMLGYLHRIETKLLDLEDKIDEFHSKGLENKEHFQPPAFSISGFKGKRISPSKKKK